MNNLAELKTTLLEIHERDKKQTITALITAEVFAVLVFGLIGYSIFSGSSTETPKAILYILLFLPVGVLIPYIVMLIQAKKRPEKIMEFVNRLEKGESVNNVDTYTDYKLTLPLRIVRIRLFPMEYAHVRVGQSRSFFKLPLSAENVQPFKALISQPALHNVSSIGGSSANWSSN
ncbi:hypothetical protein HGH93_04080 [Chitinophaga polysaccharea]|uniref:hypothetical protein n=1 Tax=Chitinophaga TaxID=79328 RepID=UPI0014554D64|nr:MULTISPECIES: hypothetical protein [Chitinophaga]NLR57261.1 hypothetical protein [Chitinophaga polysaccharea]NLU91621.1 hypothetical protein [Chitinophaga sp. Ak27]